MPKLNLTYQDSTKISDKKAKLSEPSGLTFAENKKGFWTIDDEAEKVFYLNKKGVLKTDKSFKVSTSGFEGICLHPKNKELLLVKEDTNEIVCVDIQTQTVISRHKLKNMKGYKPLKELFANSAKENKGLEGICWDSRRGTFFAVKEGNPGLILEISKGLKKIHHFRYLDKKNGFVDKKLEPGEIDFSDICYDEKRDCLWIVSDRASRVFVYDWQKDKVLSSHSLRDGEGKRIKKPEGIAILPEKNELFIVCDESAILYRYLYHFK